MKFQSISKSKRHAKFYDVHLGDVFFTHGFAYIKTSRFEDDNDIVNAVQLDGLGKGDLVFFEEDDEVSILTTEIIINYEEEDVKSWV